ncbi:MAG: hypothetical protein HY721_05955 [Planctomycetes bacterium]|nr:hypothetical protein [Planctomycetota bacterium]
MQSNRLKLESLLLCLSALGLPGLARGEATFKVGTATVAPGQTQVSIPLSVELDPAEGLIVATELTIEYDPAVFGQTAVKVVGPIDRFVPMDQSTYEEPGNVGAAILWDLFGNGRGIESSGVFAHLELCVLDTAAAGSYPVAFLFGAKRRIGGRDEVFTVYTAEGATHYPEL